MLPKIITISGVDGSGKTTIANYLKSLLEKDGHRTILVHTGAVNIGHSLSDASISPYLAPFIFLKDYGQIITAIVRNMNADYIIFDRGVADTLVKIAYKTRASRILLTSVLLRSVPSRSILLLADPDVTHGRDTDHSRTYHVKKDRLYRLLARKSSFIVFDASLSLASLKKNVHSAVKEIR